ncbi:MAG: alpha-galactosidase [Bacilli bacterium]|nr:alpha-galactosidase [Bacilli bacterium]
MLDVQDLQQIRSNVRRTDGTTAADNELSVEKTWSGNLLKSRVVNHSDHPQRIREVVLFAGNLPCSADTPFYGEGYQMLAQYSGTLTSPYVIGAYGTDWDFFRIPKNQFNQNLWTVYNMIILSPENEPHLLAAFTSCNRFSGEFRFKETYMEIIMDTEDLWLEPGQSWELEEFLISSGSDRNQLLDGLAECINNNHPRMTYHEIPAGWCSFYCLRPMTAEGLYENARAMKERIPELQRIQIDGGYAASNGDWYIPNPRLGADLKTISQNIRDCGVEAAGYLSPFIVNDQSKLFQQHPDWMVQDEEGKPFNEIGRKREWYMLDGTHPEAVNYLRNAVRHMHDEWGWRYFKFDFLAYGALPGGCRYDKNATRVEAFRRVMQAFVDEVGDDSFILGCNAPFWPLLGLAHGNRATNDIYRDWKHVKGLAQEMFGRNWQNNTLWYNDPDVIVLEKLDFTSRNQTGEVVVKRSMLTDDEFEFHKAFIAASGGMILSGDLIAMLSEKNLQVLKKLLPPTGVAARFDDTSYTIGRIDLGDRQLLCLFNWDDEAKDVRLEFDGRRQIFDFWTDEELGVYNGSLELKQMNPHFARVLYYKS